MSLPVSLSQIWPRREALYLWVVNVIFKMNIFRSGDRNMASTSMTLGPHWETFIKSEIESGRFKNTSEVVRAGLRELEERREKLSALRDHLVVGFEQTQRGEFVEGFSPGAVIARAKKRAAISE
jgi:antitoxin ParD1/3/4